MTIGNMYFGANTDPINAFGKFKIKVFNNDKWKLSGGIEESDVSCAAAAAFNSALFTASFKFFLFDR